MRVKTILNSKKLIRINFSIEIAENQRKLLDLYPEKLQLKFLRYILFLISVLFLFNASSQSKEIKTLRNKLEAKDSGISSIELLKEFFNEDLKGISSKNKVETLEKVFALSEIQNNEDLKLFVGIKIAGLHSRLGQSDLSLEMYYNLLPLAEKQDDFVSLAIINTGMGSEYFFLKEYEKALTHFKNAYNVNKKYRDSSEIAGSINNIGTTYSRIGEVDSALNYINLGLTYFTNLKDTSKIARTLNNKGSLYHRKMGKTREALVFFEEALRLQITMKQVFHISILE